MPTGRYEERRESEGLGGKHGLAKEFLAGIAGAEVSSATHHESPLAFAYAQGVFTSEHVSHSCKFHRNSWV